MRQEDQQAGKSVAVANDAPLLSPAHTVVHLLSIIDVDKASWAGSRAALELQLPGSCVRPLTSPSPARCAFTARNKMLVFEASGRRLVMQALG